MFEIRYEYKIIKEKKLVYSNKIKKKKQKTIISHLSSEFLDEKELNLCLI